MRIKGAVIYEKPGRSGAEYCPVRNRDLGPKRVGGCGLKGTSSATTVRTSKGKQTVHDGPFGDTKEQLGGFYLIEAPDLDAALEIAKQVPLAEDGAIEIRPVLGPG